MQTKKKILIVDEDSNYISALRKELSQAGYDVVYWDDGKKALELTENLKPDLIISEVDLPQINGHMFFNEVKSIPELKKVPFIFISSQKRVNDRIQSMEIGVDDFIMKPFHVEEVIARIENLLHEYDSLKESKDNNGKGFSGSLSEMNLIDLIQTLEVGKKSAIIKLKYDTYQGSVHIQNGEIAGAAFQDLPPDKALLKMFLWTDGTFFVEMSKFDQQKTITQDTKELIADGLKRVNRWEQIKKNLPPLNTAFTVNQILLNENNLSDNESILLSSLNGNTKIYDIVVKSPFDDIKTLEVIENLYQKGYLQRTNENYLATTDNYLTKIKKNLAKDVPDSSQLSYIITNLLKKPEDETEIKVERRKDDRRQIPDRRKSERRKDQRFWKNKIYLDKTELLMIREKLI